MGSHAGESLEHLVGERLARWNPSAVARSTASARLFLQTHPDAACVRLGVEPKPYASWIGSGNGGGVHVLRRVGDGALSFPHRTSFVTAARRSPVPSSQATSAVVTPPLPLFANQDMCEAFLLQADWFEAAVHVEQQREAEARVYVADAIRLQAAAGCRG